MDFNTERSVYVNDDINLRSLAEPLAGIAKFHSDNPAIPITLFITSTGGNVSDAFAAYEYITKILKPNLRTVVLGEASSAAIMLFLVAEKRYIGRLAIMRFHRFNFTMERSIPFNARQLERICQNLQRSEETYMTIIAEKCSGIAVKEIKDLLDNETVVSAFRAVELGLAHEII